MNGRGSPFSQTHSKSKIDSFEYWDFSFEDLGYEMKEAVDYIYQHDGKKVVYLDHSQGGMQILTALGDDRFKRDLESKIYRIYSVTPVLCVKGDRSMLSVAARFYSLQEASRSKLGMTNLGTTRFRRNFVRQIEEKVLNFICGIHHSVCFLGFWDTDMTNELNSMDKFGTFFTLNPTVAPLKGLIHFVQIGLDSNDQNCLARRYNYGKEQNIAKYGTEVSPVFNISSIKVPVRAYFGTNDRYYDGADIEDFAKLMSKVPDFSYQVKDKWAHRTFGFGTKSSEFYEDVCEDLNKTLSTSPLK